MARLSAGHFFAHPNHIAVITPGEVRMAEVERPEGFGTVEHRALVLLARSPEGLAVGDDTDAHTIAADTAHFLYRARLAFVTAGPRSRATIEQSGRQLVAALHAERYP